MPLRRVARDLVIRGLTLSRLDSLRRGLTAREARRRGTHLVQVVNLHGTPRASADALRRQVDWVCENFSVIDFETLTRCWDRSQVDPGCNGRPAVLFSFDDGLASNYEVAAPIIEAAAARAVFFIVPGFVQCQGEEARRFFSEHVSPGADTTRLPGELWKPMSPDQVAELARRGHTIANHTFSHARLSSLPPSAQLREIVDGAELLRTWTGAHAEAFGWTYTWDAIDATAWRVARENHRFCFAPCPGTIEAGVDSPGLLWRANVEGFYAPHEYRFIYSGLVNPFWARQRRWLRNLLAEIEDVEPEVLDT